MHQRSKTRLANSGALSSACRSGNPTFARAPIQIDLVEGLRSVFWKLVEVRQRTRRSEGSRCEQICGGVSQLRRLQSKEKGLTSAKMSELMLLKLLSAPILGPLSFALLVLRLFAPAREAPFRSLLPRPAQVVPYSACTPPPPRCSPTQTLPHRREPRRPPLPRSQDPPIHPPMDSTAEAALRVGSRVSCWNRATCKDD